MNSYQISQIHSGCQWGDRDRRFHDHDVTRIFCSLDTQMRKYCFFSGSFPLVDSVCLRRLTVGDAGGRDCRRSGQLALLLFKLQGTEKQSFMNRPPLSLSFPPLPQPCPWGVGGSQAGFFPFLFPTLPTAP